MKRTFKWDWPSSDNNIQPAVQKFENYLQDNGNSGKCSIQEA